MNQSNVAIWGCIVISNMHSIANNSGTALLWLGLAISIIIVEFMTGRSR